MCPFLMRWGEECKDCWVTKGVYTNWDGMFERKVSEAV